MIAGETPILFSKACELFIVELAYRSWIHTLENNRRTLQRCDIANAISRTDFYDFLIDIVEESCRDKLHMCASYQMDPLNVNFPPNFYPQNIMGGPQINNINAMNIYYAPKMEEYPEHEAAQIAGINQGYLIPNQMPIQNVNTISFNNFIPGGENKIGLNDGHYVYGMHPNDNDLNKNKPSKTINKGQNKNSKK
jgi:hypothetical protein